MRVVFPHRKKIVARERDSRTERVLDSLGQVVAWYTVGDDSVWGILGRAIT